jgi:site-specific DNA recombinase
MSTEATPYFRVSGERQETERQHGTFLRDVGKAGLTPSGMTYQDQVSASAYSKKRRPDFERLCEDVESGKLDGQTLWFDEVSRSSRKINVNFLVLAERCAERGINWLVKNRVYVLANKSDMVDLLRGVLDAASEVNNISSHVLEAVHVTIEKGRPHGRIPFGYARTYDPDNGELIEQIEHPEHGPIVREIIRRYAAGESTKVIADDLNARGVPCPHNAKPAPKARGGRIVRGHMPDAVWHGADISGRATNPVYLGKRHYSGTQAELIGRHEGKWLPLTTPEEHQACKDRLARKTARPVYTDHWLTGIMTCVNAADGRDHYVGTREKFGRQVYVCRVGCFLHTEAEVDKFVMAAMAHALTDKEWVLIRKADTSDVVAALTATLSEVKAKIERIKARKDVDSEDKLDALAPLRRQIKALEAEIVEVSVPGPLRELHEAEDRMLAFLDMGRHRRREVTREIVTIVASPAGRGVRRTAADLADYIKVVPIGQSDANR